ncbi:PerC family transcriptional regulator [Salmonella enterica]|uniref:PerC family transcriptional regulator n=1 Tax=Salmonella enterica TaxID=28901 RepID=UPI00316A3DFD
MLKVLTWKLALSPYRYGKEDGPSGAAKVMALTSKDRIANFVYYNPRAPLSAITESAFLGNNNSCSCILSKLIKEGKVIRERHKKISLFSAAPGYVPVVDQDALPPKHSPAEIQRIEQRIADLEARGMWRRASTLLAELSVMQSTAQGVGLVAHRRNQCIRKMRASA